MEAEVTEVPSSEPAPPASSGGLDSYFKLSERGTNIGTEVRAGVTTFLVMAYIIFLNPRDPLEHVPRRSGARRIHPGGQPRRRHCSPAS